MNYNEINWKAVPNTVTKRMVDSSFVHKLAPSKRICRRTKVMNTVIRHLHSFKSYKEYVKIKTAILRNLSDDDDTDDNIDLSDNEYSVLYKSDRTLTNYMTDMKTADIDYSWKAKPDVSDYNISDTTNPTTNAQQSKSKSPNTINLGWQQIIKKRNVKPTCSQKEKSTQETTQESKPNKLNETNNYEPSMSSSNKIVCKKDTVSSVQETCNRNMCSNKNTSSINKQQGTNKNYTSSMEGESNISNDAYKKLNKSNCSKTPKSKEKLNGIRRDLISFLDEETIVQHVDKHSANSEVCAKEGYSMLQIECVKVQEESADDSKSSESSQMQPPFNGNMNHPKDSGIDEDTEEEFQNGKIVYAKKKKKMSEICKTANVMSPADDRKNASTIETTSPNTDNLLSDIHDISHITNSQCTALLTNEDTNNEKEDQNKLQKVKLQPKVTCTKIIKNKYRIISDNASLLNKSLESNVSNDQISNKAMDPVDTKHNVEDSMSPLSKKRLQQMRRLNLTGDSESSFSEDDNEYCNTENMRDKLFKRSKEPSDLSESEDENISFKHVLSLQHSNKLKTNENYTFGNNRRKNRKTNSNNYKDTLHSSSETETYLLTDEYKTNPQNSFKQSVHYSGSESDSAKENTKHERLFQKNNQTERITINDKTATRTPIKNSAIRTRPHNLQELMDEENLVCETTLPSITLKDLQENNIYVLDIPSMVLETKLLESKFILTENKLKLGKHKYKIAFNDIDYMSCVLSTGDTGESCTDYKAVNIKPIKKLVAYEKIVKRASEK